MDKQYEIDETKRKVFARDGWRCRICGNPLNGHAAQLAHRIPQTVRNLEKYGAGIIHHPINLWSTCSLRCNQKANIGNLPEMVKSIVEEIQNGLEKN